MAAKSRFQYACTDLDFVSSAFDTPEDSEKAELETDLHLSDNKRHTVTLQKVWA